MGRENIYREVDDSIWIYLLYSGHLVCLETVESSYTYIVNHLMYDNSVEYINALLDDNY